MKVRTGTPRIFPASLTLWLNIKGENLNAVFAPGDLIVNFVPLDSQSEEWKSLPPAVTKKIQPFNFKLAQDITQWASRIKEASNIWCRERKVAIAVIGALSASALATDEPANLTPDFIHDYIFISKLVFAAYFNERFRKDVGRSPFCVRQPKERLSIGGVFGGGEIRSSITNLRYADVQPGRVPVRPTFVTRGPREG